LLEELGRLQRLEQRALVETLGRSVVQLVQHVALQELLVRDAHLDGVSGRNVLVKPGLDERHVEGTAGAARATVEWVWGPVQSNTRGGVLCVELSLLEQGRDGLGESEFLLFLIILLILFVKTNTNCG
jgi:hypothetical protein